MSEIGLFPLGLVLLPGERTPLHIFEPRYRELIAECLQRGTEFGIVLADDSGMRTTGTKAAILEVLERFDDGRSNVVVEGRERFQVIRLTEGRSFLTAETEALIDDGGPPDGEVLETCLAAYRRLIAAAGESVPELEPGAPTVSFDIAAIITFPVSTKQDLLESTSENERLVRIGGFLAQAAEAVTAGRVARERAGGNGKVDHF